MYWETFIIISVSMLKLPVFHGNQIYNELLNTCAIKLFDILSTMKVFSFIYLFNCKYYRNAQ